MNRYSARNFSFNLHLSRSILQLIQDRQRQPSASVTTQARGGGSNWSEFLQPLSIRGGRRKRIGMSSYYYTVGEPRVTQTSSCGVSGWRLSVNYSYDPRNCRPDKLKRNQAKVSRADSNAKKFWLPGKPAIYSREEDALAKKEEFHDRIEDLVRGNRPLHSRAAAAPPSMPRQFRAARQATRVMAMRARYRQAQAKLSRE